MLKHLLTLEDISYQEISRILERAIKIKSKFKSYKKISTLEDKFLGMLFDKSSTRTRISFEAAMAQMGGSTITLNTENSQISKGESLADTARILSSMLDCIVVRMSSHADVQELARNATIPVINGLTDLSHPCQLLADIMTYKELKGKVENIKIAWVGDGSNVCNSYIFASNIFGFDLAIASPINYQPNLKDYGYNLEDYKRVSLTTSVSDAVRDADLVVTDSWISMGFEDDKEQRVKDLSPYQINAKVMALAKKEALFMHCLPAHRGQEVTDEVIDGAQSIVFKEAENRLHVQKAILEYLILQSSK